MNRSYRLVWSRAHGSWVAASENTRSRSGKSGRTARPARRAWLLALPLGMPLFAGAAPPVGSTTGPTGGHVTVGVGSITQGQHTTTIRQGSQNLSLGWQTFNVGANDTVNFVQPNAQAIAVNRIADTRGSVILGRLNANGQVFLINPNGVLFGRGAQVNVGGLVASTLNVADSELGSGTFHFSADSTGTGTGRVVNQGTITAAPGGYVALLGHAASNQGTISAPAGTAALAGGEAVTLRFDGNHLLDMQVDRSTLDTLAENRQLIVADGGQVLMSAGARDSLLASVVNNSGVIQARTVKHRDGKIVLLGGMAAGRTKVAGTLDASAPSGGDGGFIETSAAQVQVADGAKITTRASDGQTGTWLIDPTDFTIAAGSGASTSSSIGADTLSSNLGSNNVRIETVASGSENGDIHVNSAVSWSANELTLSAHGDININASLNGSGTAKLALEYGQSAVAAANIADYHVNATVSLAAGYNFSTKLGSDGTVVQYQVITDLGAMGSVTGTDLQGINGNLAGNYVLGENIDASTTSGWNNGAGFAPIMASVANPNPNPMCPPICGPLPPLVTPFTGTFDGLGNTINNLTINLPANDYVGLFGQASGAEIRNVGLLGGSIKGRSYVGGLVGRDNDGIIARAYATGMVTGSQAIGGLVGSSRGSTITESYATGEVIGSAGYVGGLVGELGTSGSTITDAYATGSVRGTYNVGGLVGFSAGSINGAYAAGAVTGNSVDVGGLVGRNISGGVITNGYWDSYSTGMAGVGVNSGTGSITAITSDPSQSGAANYAFKPSAYAGFDFTPGTGAWFMVNGGTRPFLQSEYSTTIGNTHQLQLMAMNLAASYTLTGNLDASATARAVNSGAAADASGMWSNAGFKPIGDSFPNWFSGSFDGLGHTISGLTINRPSTDYVGLFGATLSSSISHVGLLGGSVVGRTQVGSLVGRNNGQVDHAYATGTVNGTTFVGGLVGFSAGSIANAYATGAVTGISDVGGLVGRSENGTISQAYAMGAVSGQDNVGGLIGTNWYSTISQAYATGQIVGTGANAGGLVGWNNSGTTTNSYWATDTTAQATSDGGTGMSAAGLVAALPAGFDAAVWGNQNNQTTPYLLGNIGPVFVAGGGSTLYTPVFALSQLQAIDSGVSSLAGSYALFADIDAAATSGWNGGAGFNPIGDYITSFTGIFDGLGHTISGLTINRPTTFDIGLFGFIASGSEIRNIGLNGASVTGQETVGGLVGYNRSSTVRNAYATGTVNGNRTVGGLVGYAYQGTIDNAYATGTVSGTADSIGGLVGGSYQGTISHAYATGTVSGTSRVGGLVGDNNSAVSQSYATGAVSGSATYVGGLIGANNAPASITTSYWDTQTTGQNHSAGSADSFGLSSADMLKASSFAGWGLATTGGSNAIWRIYEGQTSPLLRRFMTTLTVTANDVATTYNGGAWTGSAGYTTGALTPTAWLPSATVDSSLILGSVGTGTPAINAGSYAIDGGLSSGQLGYDIAFTGGTLTIAKAALELSTSAVAKTYDGTLLAAGTAVVRNGTLFAADTLGGGSFAFTDKNVGIGKTVTVSGVTVSDGNGGGNYEVTYVDNTASTISAKAITVSATGVNKVYDGSVAASAALAGTGLVTGDVVSFGGTATFDDKNAGTGKTVTVNGITASGADAGNYTFNTTSGTTADIAAKVIAVNAAGVDKVYDGGTAAQAALVGNGAIDGDTVAFDGIANFDDRNVGTGKTLTVSGITASGADAGNYSFAATASATADITPATLTYHAAPASIEAGQNLAGLAGTVAGLVGGETLAAATTGTLTWTTLATAASAPGHYVIAGGGLSAGNYVFAQAPGNAGALTVLAGEPVVPDLPTLAEVPVIAALQRELMHASGESDPWAEKVKVPMRVIGTGIRLP